MTSATVGDARTLGGFGQDWIITLLLGTATLILGIVLILNPFTSAWTLALLAGIGLLANGVLQLFRSVRAHDTGGIVAGVLLVLGGIIAIAWPGITLWALAVVVGVSILVGGAGKGAAALMDGGFRGRWLLLASGLISIAVGVIAIVWPKATIVVLAILFGIQIGLFGLLEIAAALELRRLEHTPGSGPRPAQGGAW